MQCMKAFFFGTALSLILVAHPVLAATTNYKATIDVKQVTPPPSSPQLSASGEAALTFDDATKKLCGTITYTGLTGPTTGVHIHVGAAGSPLSGAGAQVIEGSLESPIAVEVTLSSNNVTKLVTSGLYINVHTAANADGEIRGQIVPNPSGSVQTCASAPTAADAGSDLDSGSGSSGAAPSSSSGSNDSGSGGSSGCNVSNVGTGGTGLSLGALVAATLLLSRHRRRNPRR